MHLYMYMDGMDGRTDRWMNRLNDGGWRVGQMDGWIGQMDGQTDGWTDCLTEAGGLDRWMDGWMDGWMDRRMDGWIVHV